MFPYCLSKAHECRFTLTTRSTTTFGKRRVARSPVRVIAVIRHDKGEGMDIFSSKGSAGVGVAYASFCLITSLLRHLESTGTLIPKDVNAILANALTLVPDDNISAREDARRLLKDLKR